MKNGWKTNEQVTREHYGSDWEANMETVRREQEMLSSVGNNNPDNMEGENSNE